MEIDVLFVLVALIQTITFLSSLSRPIIGLRVTTKITAASDNALLTGFLRIALILIRDRKSAKYPKVFWEHKNITTLWAGSRFLKTNNILSLQRLFDGKSLQL